MEFPAFVKALPKLDIPFSEDVVTAYAVKSDQALVVYFEAHQDFEIPEHSHGVQWGCMIHGELELTIDGVARICTPGDHWEIPAGAPHSAKLKAGSRVMDVFEEADRYPLKPAAG
ncbi:MAG: cupin domain-containing protein [Neomegalonema sp.]|nr:cupin domain-containing protein [Neomegalonema sp.]